MLGRQHHVSGAEQGVGPGGEDLDRLGAHGESHARTVGASDPVALHRLDLLGPVEPVQIIDEPVRVGGDPHHPLAQILTEDREVAALGASLGGDLLIGQNGAQAGAPVDHRVRQVHEPVRLEHRLLLTRREVGPGAADEFGGQRAVTGGELLAQLGDGPGAAGAGRVLAAVGRAGGSLGVVPGAVDLEEDPLGPAVEVGVRGGHDATAVVAQAETPELAFHVGDVGLGGHARVLAGLHGVLLGGQTERVVAQGVENVGAEHPVIAREHVGGDVAQRVADMQARARGVGEHVLHEQLVGGQLGAIGGRERTDRVGRLEGAALSPFGLPPGFDLAGQSRAVTVGRSGLGLIAGHGLIAAAHVECSPWSRRCPHVGRVQPKPWDRRGRVSVRMASVQEVRSAGRAECRASARHPPETTREFCTRCPRTGCAELSCR